MNGSGQLATTSSDLPPALTSAAAPPARPSSAGASGAVRSTLTVSPEGNNMTARWERCDDDASWQPWMDLTFTRMPLCSPRVLR